jgi:signal transduction histidine kinase/DNA-binding response OmpR family regulator
VSGPILRLEVRLEHDIVLARQRARQIAGLLGLESQDQTRVATAVSEIARNAFQYAGGGTVEFLADNAKRPALRVRVHDRGPGIKDLQSILDGRYRSATGMGLGIVGVRRLMDHFRIDSAPGAGTVVEFGKALPKRVPPLTPHDLARIGEELARHGPDGPFEEVRQQNQELLRTLEELRLHQAELAEANATLGQLNRELEDTNRGVVALYAELDEKADFLRRASETKSRFLSNMSHEFRTPLNAVTGLARLLLDRTDGELTPEQEKQVTLMRRAAEDLTELVSDLLDLAKVEAGKVIVRPQEFEVVALFGALRGMLRPLLAANSSVSLVFEEPAGLPPLNTDESKVSQVLRNFISNALKFTEHGEVRVSARVGPDDTVVFAVADTGIGIAPEYHERIFEEFTQVESARQKYVKGTGLGLPLVRKLVGLLGGRIQLTSEPGAGSTFSAVLPRVYEGPTEVAFVPEISPHVDPDRRPVLVVEDNPETLFIYEKYLKGSGFQVIPARTLPAARAALGRFRPAAVVLDVLLEGESTWELLAEIKGNEATQGVPVLVVTIVENEAKARALGADHFCAKPVDRAWLLGRLSAPPPASGKLLLIDDDEASRYLLKGMLSDTRCEVVEAADAAEGLRAALQERPRAIFLDLDLPDRSGCEVLDALRAEPGTRGIPVIISTSRPLGQEEQRRLLKAGAVAVLPKDQASREAALVRLRDVLRCAGLGEGALP